MIWIWFDLGVGDPLVSDETGVSPLPKSNNSKNINYWWFWIYLILGCISWTSAGFIWNPSKSIVCRDLSTGFGKFLWILGCWIYDADFCWFRLKSTQTNTQEDWPAHLTLSESRPSDLLANLLYHDFRKISDETGGSQGHEIETMSSTDVQVFCNVGVLIWIGVWSHEPVPNFGILLLV